MPIDAGAPANLHYSACRTCTILHMANLLNLLVLSCSRTLGVRQRTAVLPVGRWVPSDYGGLAAREAGMALAVEGGMNLTTLTEAQLSDEIRVWERARQTTYAAGTLALLRAEWARRMGA